jgi:hypothetical protein
MQRMAFFIVPLWRRLVNGNLRAVYLGFGPEADFSERLSRNRSSGVEVEAAPLTSPVRAQEIIDVAS